MTDTAAVLRLFDELAGEYDQHIPFFAPFGRDLVAWCDLRPGQRVLDIAAGRGAVTGPAAQAVGPVYELDSLLRVVAALEAEDIPLLLSVTPLRSFEEADYLANEVPGVRIPPDALRAMERAGRGAARAVGIELAADLLTQARKLVGGVILTAAEEDLTVLAPLLAVVA